MDPVHFHLAVSHAPLAACFIGLALTGLGLIIKNPDFEKAGLGIILMGALVIVPVYFSGERSEERMEHYQGISESRIEAHEEAAKPALAAFLTLGAVCAAALFFSRDPAKLRAGSILVLVLSVGVLFFLIRVSALGGQIRHTEITELKVPLPKAPG
ncbi:MAG TPA: hypothetical protein VL688_05990 [Verrucomicrobiae bacterium]|jgi:hypothetical protein|nr:hypothetical protein [Verrucomicrobiae bacterium]